MDMHGLNQSYGMPDLIRFHQDESGLIKAIVSTPACDAELYVHGAHLTSWKPADQQPVLFLSDRSVFAPGKAIRGGVPVIFPWFGPRLPFPPSERTDGPPHGFARTSEWNVLSVHYDGKDLAIALGLGPNESTRALGFDTFRAVLTVRLGAELEMRLQITNEGPDTLTYECALHTYLSVGDARAISIDGLSGARFIDKTDGMKVKTQEEGVLHLIGETDRLYLDTTSTVTVSDPTLKRRIVASKTGSNSTVVWNPWSALSARLADMADDGWERMVCIETANAADNRISLAPGKTHEMCSHLRVEEGQ